jgi:hypothetical protein
MLEEIRAERTCKPVQFVGEGSQLFEFRVVHLETISGGTYVSLCRMTTRLSQFLLISGNELVPLGQHHLLSHLPQAPGALNTIPTQRHSIPLANAFNRRTPAHPLFYLPLPEIDLGLDAAHEVALEVAQLIFESCGGETELGVDGGKEEGLGLEVGVEGVEEGR